MSKIFILKEADFFNVRIYKRLLKILSFRRHNVLKNILAISKCSYFDRNNLQVGQNKIKCSLKTLLKGFMYIF